MRRVLALVLGSLLVAAACTGAADPARRDAGRGQTGEPVDRAATSAPAASTRALGAGGNRCGLASTYPEPWPGRPRYRAHVRADPESGLVQGRLVARWAPPVRTSRLVVRLWANTPRVGRGGGRLEITAAELDGEEVTGRYRPGNGGPGTPGTIYVVRREEGFAPGREIRLVLEFTLRLPGPIDERVARVGTSLRLGSVLPLLAWVRGRGWHTSPAVDAFSEAVASEVADYDVAVEVPRGYRVLATGEEVEPGRFVATAVRDWAATVARMHLAEGRAQGGRTRVVVGVAEGTGRDPQAVLGGVVAALDDFARRYGPYPYPVLSVGVTGALGGGIEFPQHIQLGARAAYRSLVHEVAHMWFYGVVGNDQYRHPWLDEGLATYATARFLRTLARLRGTAVPEAGRGRLGAGHDYWARHRGTFFRGVYVQGAQALAELGEQAGGQAAMDCALRRFVLEQAYRVARPADLVGAIRRQTGLDPHPVLERYGAATRA